MLEESNGMFSVFFCRQVQENLKNSGTHGNFFFIFFPHYSVHNNVSAQSNGSRQEEVVKLTEKCLNNAIDSPALNARRVPPDLKSNILKAQVEAVQKVTREDNLLSHKNASVQDAATNSAELNENAAPVPGGSLIPMRTTPAENGPALKDATDELDALLLSLTENLIDHTTTPQISSISMITPRWIVPQSAALPNGLAGDNGLSPAGKEGPGNRGVVSLISPPAPFFVDAVTRAKDYQMFEGTPEQVNLKEK
ncbi:hypothetical protein E2I00_013129 [Balaenoptera physalus]|uniref:Uncharacterized protein n=1 Tax=Balaenoptera physalus TaxID=9770 RepID=A0A643CEX7_BALPH|nr:hypothetical protein E2I00_013129 [Balaenoptera physalus]